MNHIGQVSSNHYYDWVLQTDWYGESFLGRMIPIQIDDDDQSHNWSNQPRSDEDPAATVIQGGF